MANNVFANGREISCKSGSGKSIAAFPDVCMTPPENPATPPGVPVPYPNTGMTGDCASGSTTVKITGKEAMLKNKSYFKKSTGDEAGAAAKKGVVSSVNRGKVYFTAWSMDVKIEGENAVRHLDMTTHNHGSAMNTPPWPFADSMSIEFGETDDPCAEDKKKEEDACGQHGGDRSAECADTNCQKAQACKLVPYGGGGSPNCCPDVTGHHMIEDHWVTGNNAFPTAMHNAGKNAAPTVCVKGSRHTMEHGEFHCIQGLREESHMPGGVNADQPWDYGAGKSSAIMAHQMTFDSPTCKYECLNAQLDSFYGDNEERLLNEPHNQGIAINSKGDDRWLRSQAEASLGGSLGRG